MEITAAHVHQLVRGVGNGSIRTGFERQNGSTYVAGKLKQLLGQVFRYAISSGRAQNNPATMITLSDAVKPRKVRHNKALRPSQMCALLGRIDNENRMLVTRTLAATILLTACRTGEALQARWGEFDFENAVWNIPASRMKNKQPHCFPLSAQLAARLLVLRSISQKTNADDYVFYSSKAKVLPHLSRGAVNAIFAQMGLNEESNSWFRAHGGSEVIKKLLACEIDLLLLDTPMPGFGCVDFIRRVRAEWQTLPVLVLGIHNDAQIASRALRAGVTGYLMKDSAPELLFTAIRKLADGGRFIDPTLVDAMVFEKHAGDVPPHAILSDREFQVLQMIAYGKNINDIASACTLSAKTISSHKMRLMRKLGLSNNVDVIRFAIRHGLISE